MAKSSTRYVCQNCAASFPKWQGQCTSCGEWNTLVEEVVEKTSSRKSRGKQLSETQLDQVIVPFGNVRLSDASKRRFSTSIGELDRVLGGGLVAGAVILIGGEPGIGKSTLLTQMLIGWLAQQQSVTKQSKTSVSGVAETEPKKRQVLYVSGEESPSQISLRINRLINNEQYLSNSSFGQSLGETLNEQLLFVTSTNVDELVQIIAEKKPDLVIVDSIQTLTTEELLGASGSVGQVRESTDRIVNMVKAFSIPTFLVGHVTKEGTIAGPKVLEHIVDAVIELSGERTGQLRLLRALKNRFGATDEVGVFQIVEYGLREVANPSELFLENQGKSVAGSATVCVMEGTRPLLAEVQALVVNSQLAMPRRVGRGIELSRIQVLTAVLQKHVRLPLGSSDVFLSAAGGFTIKEPAVDLGLAVAMASSLTGKKVPDNHVFIGEIGLLGEIRTVPYLERRIKEAKRLGFEHVISRQSHTRVKDVLNELGLDKG